MEKTPLGKRAPITRGENFFGDPRILLNPRIFGRTDLWKSLSRAKFDEESDFEVRLAVAPQNPFQKGQKRNFRSENFAKKHFSASKNETLGIV